MTVESIKEAITELDPKEKASLTAWLVEQDSLEWDRQIEADFSPGGVGRALLDEAESEIHAGTTRSMADFLAETKASGKAPRL
jgi:hypothetical protein